MLRRVRAPISATFPEVKAGGGSRPSPGPAPTTLKVQITPHPHSCHLHPPPWPGLPLHPGSALERGVA